MLVIGVMGPGEGATKEDIEAAYQAGRIIANKGFYLLSGGRNTGIMNEASKGAKSKNGLVIGVLPDKNKSRMSEYVDIPILTGLGNARNNINILSSDLILVIGEGPGTVSEVALAIKEKKPFVLFNPSPEFKRFLEHLTETKIKVIRRIEEFEQSLNYLFNKK